MALKAEKLTADDLDIEPSELAELEAALDERGCGDRRGYSRLYGRRIDRASSRHSIRMSPAHYRLIVLSRAQKDIEREAQWWRQNRPFAPDLFLTEYRRVLNLLRDQPLLGSAFRKRPGVLWVPMGATRGTRGFLCRRRHRNREQRTDSRGACERTARAPVGDKGFSTSLRIKNDPR